MIYRVILEITDKMSFKIDVPAASGEDKAPACKATIYSSKFPKDDKCDPSVACPRCIAIRAVEADVIPIKEGMEVKIDKLEPIVDKAWATGEEPTKAEEPSVPITLNAAAEVKDAEQK